MRTGIALAGCCLLLPLAACGPTEPQENAGTIGNQTVTEGDLMDNAATANSSAAGGPLAAYVGKYPFDDLNGVAFLAHPLVRAGIARAGGDAAPVEMMLDGPGPTTPIEMADGRIVSWACEQHNCGAHNWALVIAPDGSSPELCYHNEAETPATRWLADGEPIERSGDCQSVGGDA